MRKPLLYLFTGIIVGTVVTSPVLASSDLFQVALSQVKLVINGTDKTTTGGMYWNGDANVPLAFQYEGTTYLPVRYISESLNLPIAWEGSTRTITIGNQPLSTAPVLLMGQSIQPEPGVPVTVTPVHSDLYDADSVNIIKASVAIRNDDTKPFEFTSYQSQFVGTDGSQYDGRLYLPAGSTITEIPAKTTQIVQYYATVPKKTDAGKLMLQLSKADFSTYPAQFKTWASVPMQLTAAPSSDSDYLGGQMPATLNLYPYQLQVNQASLDSFNIQAQQQLYKLNVATTQEPDVNSFPNSVELNFELLDGNGKTMAETRYAVGSSNDPNIPVLKDGDQYILFKNIEWSRFNGSGMKMRVWEVFESGKKLIGTF